MKMKTGMKADEKSGGTPEPSTGVPSFGERLIRLVYPAKCMVCGTVLDDDTPFCLCDSCHKLLPTCGSGFHKTPELPYLRGLFGAFRYAEGIDGAIRKMKFGNQPGLSKTLAFLVYEELMKEPVLPDFELIIPVPMHRRKKHRRGYNQSELVARELSRYLDIPADSGILLKTRYTRPQSRLNREQRLHNMDNAYKLSDDSDITGKIILLVDDVVTTGTTLNTCAKILYENGASWIYAAVIAIAEK